MNTAFGYGRTQRLLTRPQFNRCFESGRKHHTKSFIVFALVRDDRSGGIRLGMAVSRKVGGAVQRNRIKRVVREFFRLHQHEYDAPIDVVVVPKRSLDPRRLTLQTAIQELVPLFARIMEREVNRT